MNNIIEDRQKESSMSWLTKRRKTFGIILGIIMIGSIITYYAWYMGYLASFTVRVGYLVADIHHLPLFVAREKGWYSGTGIRFEFMQYANGPLEMMSFGVGAIDIGYLGIVPATLFRVNFGVNVVVVAASNKEGSALVVDTSVNSLNDLNNTTVATPGENTVQHYLLSLVESQYSIRISTLPIVPPSGMETTLQQGNIKGFIAWEPFPAKSVHDGVGKILLSSHEIWADHPCCALVVSNQFLKDHPDIVESVVETHVKATDFIAEQPDAAAIIGAKNTGQTKEVILDAMQRVIFNYNVDKPGIRTVLQHLIDVGWIPQGKVPANITSFLENFISTQYLGA